MPTSLPRSPNSDDRSGRSCSPVTRRTIPRLYTPIDCVAYGNYMGSLPGVGAPAVATPFESTLERSITRGCPTALDPVDDSNNSAADFLALSTHPPRNNATPPDRDGLSTRLTRFHQFGGSTGGVTVCAGKPITIVGHQRGRQALRNPGRRRDRRPARQRRDQGPRGQGRHLRRRRQGRDAGWQGQRQPAG